MTAVWYKRFPSDFLNGVSRLNAEERGVYCSLLDMMYDEGGSVPYSKGAKKDAPDSPARLSRACGCESTRRFNMIVDRLIDYEKIIIEEDRIFNKQVFKRLNPDFITDLSLNYLVVLFPEWRNFNDLAWRKKLEPRIHKKNKQKNDGSERPVTGTVQRQLHDAVIAMHGPDVWTSWFAGGRVVVHAGEVRPRKQIVRSMIRQRYEDAVRAAGFQIGELWDGEDAA